MSDSNGSSNGSGRLSGPRLWLLLRVNRWVLTGAILLIVFLVLVAGSLLDLVPLRQIAERNDGVQLLFSAFIGAIVTGTSIVVTINQLVLSQELGAVGDQRERMSQAMDFRQDVEAVLEEDVMPPEPAGFVYELLDGIERQADSLVEAVEEGRDEELREEIETYADELVTDVRPLMDDLEDAQFGTFAVIWSTLNFDYSRRIFEARQIRTQHAESLSEETSQEIEDTLELLEFFGLAREHFKTLYFQWALIELSRALLYISIPALAVMGLLIMYVDANAFVGTTLGIDHLVWVTSAGFAVGIAPFVVFVTYILRIASVAKRTLAIGPFLLRETEREEELG